MGNFSYPWGVLGLWPQASERDIKKAYARLLRQTRPDEDPKGFQALVAARDLALVYARRAEALRRDATPLEGRGAAETGPAAEPAGADNAKAPLPKGEVFPPAKDRADAPPPPPVAEAASPNPQEPKPDADAAAAELAGADNAKTPLPTGGGEPPADERADVPPLPLAAEAVRPDPLDVKPDTDAATEARPEPPAPSWPVPPAPLPPAGAQAAPQPAAAAAEELPARQQVTDAIVSGLGPDASEAQISDAMKAAAGLHLFPLAERRQAEPPLLRALLSCLPGVWISLRAGGGGPPAWYDAQFFRRSVWDSKRRARRQVELVLLLNEEYGWTASDRGVYQLAGREQAATGMHYLRIFERAAQMAKAAGYKDLSPFLGAAWGAFSQKQVKTQKDAGPWPYVAIVVVVLTMLLKAVMPAGNSASRHFPPGQFPAFQPPAAQFPAFQLPDARFPPAQPPSGQFPPAKPTPQQGSSCLSSPSGFACIPPKPPK